MEEPVKPPFGAYTGNEPYLFVSYAHLDKRSVYPIIEYLDRKGVRIWYDEGIPAASNWIEQIADTIITEMNIFFKLLTIPKLFIRKNFKDETLYLI